MTMKDIKSYTSLSELQSYEDRVKYLKLDGAVGTDTFGFDRYLNQQFYRSTEWKRVRDQVIVRDGGCDLGDPNYPIAGKVLIHHMNPITPDDIKKSTEFLMNPEYLVCVSMQTHNLIHYGDDSRIGSQTIERSPNDTCPWRQ